MPDANPPESGPATDDLIIWEAVNRAAEPGAVGEARPEIWQGGCSTTPGGSWNTDICCDRKRVI